jgi:hypothetical protein
MNLPELHYNFYNASIHSVALGPRHEATLAMELWPQVNGKLARQWRRGEGEHINIRFGSIDNYTEVMAFFGSWEDNRNRSHGLHYLSYSSEKKSKPGNLFFEFEWDWTGDHFVIHCRNITITQVS